MGLIRVFSSSSGLKLPRLKQDILKEAARYGGLIQVQEEIEGNCERQVNVSSGFLTYQLVQPLSRAYLQHGSPHQAQM